ncbi:conjugal transfer protein TraG N-terminal domain-containing protein, partial [Azospirillum sp. OGB3]|uniref:conjugal transfer protein TraG N-terminal domain-containing protein n=1 Tax=Azospirillum sp. OGB3 TaxID=2587012 RepID=UPI001606D18B
MWNINSIGDAAFLAEILNAVAMIVGTGEFYAVAQIGLLLGALLVCFQAVGAGARAIDWQKVFLGWVVFSLLFGPPTTVTVTDAYTGQVRPIANVPVGVAAGGSLISEIGYQLTLLFEQGFSMPSMTQHGYGSALEVLKKVRITTGDPVMLGAANNFAGGSSNFAKSWAEYVAACTTVGISRGDIDAEKLYKSNDLVQALKWDSFMATTRLWIRASGEERYECSEGHAELVPVTSAVITKYMNEVLPPILNVPPLDVSATIGNALLGLGVTSVSPEQFVATSILQPIFERGSIARSEEDRAFSYAKMIEDAKNQRAMSWMGEASMFRSIVRPMLTFLEGFTYAVTPIMGFLVVLGPMGISIAGKYVLTLLWIQLWMPVLAIVNLFIHLSLTKRFAGLEDSGFSLDSMNGLLAADGALQKWISTGEMLASSVPALTLMLIYGGSVAATHLAGRLQGGDFIKEDKVARDTFNAAPKYQIAPDYTVDSSRVTMASGKESSLLNFSMGSLAQSQVSSLQNVADAKTQTFADSLGTTIARQVAQQHKDGTSDLFKSGSGFTNSESYKLMSSRMEDITRQYAKDNTVGQQLINAAAMEYGLTGQISAKTSKALAAQFGAKGVDQMSESTGSSASEKIIAGIKSQYGREDALSGELKKTAVREAATTSENSFTQSLSETDQRALTQTAQQALTAQKAYQEAEMAQQSFGSTQALGAGQAVQNVNMGHGGKEGLEGELLRHNKLAARDAYVRNDARNGGVVRSAFRNDDDFITYAGLVTLNNNNPLGKAASAAEATEMKASLFRVLSSSSNHDHGKMGDASKFASLSDKEREIPEIASGVEQHVAKIQPLNSGAVGRPSSVSMPTEDRLKENYQNNQMDHVDEFTQRGDVKRAGRDHERVRLDVKDDVAKGEAHFNRPSVIRGAYFLAQGGAGDMKPIDPPRATVTLAPPPPSINSTQGDGGTASSANPPRNAPMPAAPPPPSSNSTQGHGSFVPAAASVTAGHPAQGGAATEAPDEPVRGAPAPAASRPLDNSTQGHGSFVPAAASVTAGHAAQGG